jgi:hypothetical protein
MPIRGRDSALRRLAYRRLKPKSRSIAMDNSSLALLSTGQDDYAVIDDGEPVGRIRHAKERTNDIWLWNVTVALPGGGNGNAPTLETAKAAFRERWTKFKAGQDPVKLAKAFQTARAVKAKGK